MAPPEWRRFYLGGGEEGAEPIREESLQDKFLAKQAKGDFDYYLNGDRLAVFV